MEMKVMREEIALEKRLAAGEGQAMVEGSVPLPGGLRQETKVLYAGATATVERAEAMQDKVSCGGRAMFHVLYTQGDPGQIRALEATADFSSLLDAPGAQARGACQAEAEVEQVTSAVSSGQLSLRAQVRLRFAVTAREKVNAVTGLQDVEGLETQTQTLTVLQLSGGGAAEPLLREEFELPASMAVTETLFATADARVEEVSGGAGRAAVSGQVALTVYHAAALPETPLTVTRHTIPFAQTVELTGSCGDALVADVTVRDVAVASQDAGEDGRVLRAEVQLSVRVRAQSEDHLTVLQDAYTTSGDTLALKREQVAYIAGATSLEAAESGKTTLLLPEDAPPLKRVLCVFARPVAATFQPSGSRLTVEGRLSVTLLGVSREDDLPVSVQTEQPFRQAFAVQFGEGDGATISVEEAEGTAITSDRIEVRYVMRVKAQGETVNTAEIVTDVTQTPTEETADGAIVLYFAQPGDTLWTIARTHRVPESDVRRLNPEVEGDPQPGQGLVLWRRCVV